jgi:hypothetical protein
MTVLFAKGLPGARPGSFLRTRVSEDARNRFQSGKYRVGFVFFLIGGRPPFLNLAVYDK